MTKKISTGIILLIVISLSINIQCNAENFTLQHKAGNRLSFKQTENQNLTFHQDSTHRLNFRYHDKKRGIKPWIAPALLISTGSVLHQFEVKETFQDYVQDNFAYTGKVDDYLQFAPVAAVYGLNLMGIKGKNNFGNTTALAIKSMLLNDFIFMKIKVLTDSERPNGNKHSFPSGHTAVAFASAHFMHKEYGHHSPWYSIGAYTCAGTVGLMRVAKNAHWLSDVIAGAGVGILSTELVYLTHLYKWDKAHLKRMDIFPFQVGKQKGITMVYRF